MEGQDYTATLYSDEDSSDRDTYLTQLPSLSPSIPTSSPTPTGPETGS